MKTTRAGLMVRLGATLGVILILTALAGGQEEEREGDWWVNCDSIYYDRGLGTWVVPCQLEKTSASDDTIVGEELLALGALTYFVDCGDDLGCYFGGDTEERHLIVVDLTEGQTAETLMVCRDIAHHVLTTLLWYDVYAPARLIAVDLSFAVPRRQGSLVARFESPCQLETLAILDSAQYPTFLGDGSVALANSYWASAETDEPQPNIVVYDVEQDTVYEPFPRDRMRARAQGWSREEPIYYRAGGISPGIYRFRLGQETEELVFGLREGERFREWQLHRDSVVILTGVRADTGYSEVSYVVDASSLQATADTVFLGTDRPSWDPAPYFSLRRGDRPGRLYLVRESGKHFDTLGDFGPALVLDSYTEGKSSLLDWSGDSCRLIVISHRGEKPCDTAWICDSTLLSLIVPGQCRATGNSLLLLLPEDRGGKQPADRQPVKAVLSLYRRDCRLDTLAVLEEVVDPFLSEDGSQLLAAKLVPAADGHGEIVSIFSYDVASGETDFPLKPDKPRWLPKQRHAGDWLYYLRRDSATNIYRFLPEHGEKQVTTLPPPDSVTWFHVSSDAISYGYCERSKGRELLHDFESIGLYQLPTKEGTADSSEAQGYER